MLNKIKNRLKFSSVAFSYKHGTHLWLSAPAADCTAAEVAAGRICTDADLYNKWNPVMKKNGFPSPYKADQSWWDKVLLFFLPDKY